MRLKSLSVRLALWVGLLGLLQGAGVLWFSYLTMQQEFAAQRRSVLRDKVDQARQLIGDMPDEAAIRAKAFELVDLVTGHAELHLAIARQGATVPTVAFSREASESLIRLKDDTWGTDAFLEWRANASGAPMLSQAGAVQLQNGEAYEIVATVDRSDDQRLLRSLLLTSLTAAPFGLALVIVSALAIAVWGLQPLRRFQKATVDITARNLSARIDSQGLPSELQDLGVAFNAMLERLDDGVRRLSEFSEDLAHEMRTPLATLLGRTQVGLSQPRTAEQLTDLLESNVDELQRLSRLVSDMLFLAQADHAQTAVERSELDLANQARTVAEFLQVLADERDIEISVEGRAVVVADGSLVQRAITNLLSNAVRHGARGKPVKMTVSYSDEHHAALEVVNLGTPIAPEHLERLFDRFYRVDSSRARDLGGTGLGLAIVKAIIGLHGGRVAATSSAGGETRLTLYFPREHKD
ncbi:MULTISPECIES: heavy metal sensor histidine kinase [Variovorax]|jgi:two-component system heavy metal sensor histidine kinase CusS|uniref:heavy metal sensor histidine kinase n=1 Tax=Variovorax sp. 3P27G3 TaxID=2502214 RepID=UPI0010F507D3|nr:heavy metal sensor histidine kinase [Variovorax sp. 3P27G3]